MGVGGGFWSVFQVEEEPGLKAVQGGGCHGLLRQSIPFPVW